MFLPLRLDHPILVAFDENQRLKAERLARNHHHLPAHPAQLAHELNEMVDGVPVVFDRPYEGSTDWSVRFFGSTFVARLYRTTAPGKHGYYLSRLNPPRLRSNEDLLRGCLLVRPAGWHVVGAVRDIPPEQRDGWDRMAKGWRQVVEAGWLARLSPRHRAYLDTLEQVIEADHRITSDARRAAEPYPYQRFEATGGPRRKSSPVYTFRVAGRLRPDRADHVQVRALPDSRGRVTTVEGAAVTVSFDQPLDYTAIPPQGELEITPSDAAYREQKKAVKLIRGGHARGTVLLHALVDRHVAVVAPRHDEPGESLNERQLSAYRKGLAVEDVLVVLGPPGTGKTRTIRQLAHTAAHAGSPDPVLVTAQSNRAVDNVLSKLPADLVVVRVGGDGVTDEGAPYLLERQASDLRQEIMGRTTTLLDTYAGIPNATHQARELDGRLAHLATLDAAATLRRQELTTARRAVAVPAWTLVDGLGADHRRLERRLARLRRRTERLRRWRAHPVLQVLAGLIDRRLAAADAEEGRLREALVRNRAQCAAALHDVDVATRDVPAVRAARLALDEVIARQSGCRDEARTAANAALSAVPAGSGARAPISAADPAALISALVATRDWLGANLPALAARQQLLTEWRAEVADATDQLYPELIRYAHVVAATCTGAASRKELAGVDFELAIVDEAGQVNLANALVPLVRARRAVLVGDQQQLPPFLDAEVEKWGRSVGSPEVRELLTKSALELLVEALGDQNVVPLVEQRRMPRAIADFISAQFYRGELQTVRDRVYQGPLFDTPFVFVDTSALPTHVRRERSTGRREEAVSQPSRTNPLEADLLRDLALYYEQKGMEWAIIVPYKAQRNALVAMLAPRLGSEAAALKVGTVDSFQGGERDVVLWGATCSNPAGNVGFLRELRRSNVAFSRAKYQLLLVGDLSTLRRATDPGFRGLVLALVDHLRDRGEIRPYREVVDRLAQAVGGDGAG